MQWFEIIAGSFGIAGLFVSLWAALAAEGAKRAARNATRSARRASAVEDFVRLGHLGEEFLVYVQVGDISGALVRGRDLLAGTQDVSQRWQRFMRKEGPAALSSSQRLVNQAISLLATRGSLLSASEKERLLNLAAEVLQILKSESGKLTSSIEEREE